MLFVSHLSHWFCTTCYIKVCRDFVDMCVDTFVDTCCYILTRVRHCNSPALQLTQSSSVRHESETFEFTVQETTTQIRPFGLLRDLRIRVHWVCAYVCRNMCVETCLGLVGGRNVTPSRRADTLNLCHVQNLAWSNSQCKRAWHRYVYVVLADISQAVCIGFMHMFAETCV